jgi:hypothetical protein
VSQLVPGVGIVPEDVQQHEFATELADGAPTLLASRREPAPAPVVVWVAGAMLLTAMTIAAERQRRTAGVHVR